MRICVKGIINQSVLNDHSGQSDHRHSFYNMTKNEQNKWSMFRTVHSVCKDAQGQWSGLPAFGPLFDELTIKLAELRELEHKQAQSLLGKQDAVKQQRLLVSGKAGIVLSALRAYSVEQADIELQAAMKTPSWKLQYGNKVAAVEFIDRILDAGSVHVNELGNYGIAQADIDNLALERDRLGELMVTPRMAIIDRKNTTAQIKQLITYILHLLRDRMDQLVEVLKPGHAKFAQRYENARQILDYKKKKKTDPLGDGPGLIPVNPL